MDVIDLCESDSEEEIKMVTFRKNPRLKRIKTEIKTEGVARIPQALDISDDDEIEIVEKEKPDFATAAGAKTTGEDDDDDGDNDVEMVGFIGDKLPHMRCHCTEMPFQSTCIRLKARPIVQASLAGNKKTCDLCYCYVCDIPANDCKSWAPTTEGATAFTSNAHCMAFDKGDGAHRWKLMRQDLKNESSGGSSMTALGQGNSEWSTASILDRLLGRHIEKSDDGPFPPTRVGPIGRLTKCRKCGWFNQLVATSADNFVSCRHWCHKCGRVVSEKYLHRDPSSKASTKGNLTSDKSAVAYKRHAIMDVLLGEKIIPFTIKAHDPRKIMAFKDSWEENDGPEWTYNEADMQHDAFRQRFGPYTQPGDIIGCVPIVAEIPVDGRFSGANGADSAVTNSAATYGNSTSATSISETEGVILESHNHISLLRELSNYRAFGVNGKAFTVSSPVVGQIRTAWDKNAQNGTFTVTVFLRPCSSSAENNSATSMTKFLGAWFGVFPYPVASLVPGLSATDSDFTSACRYGDSLPLPPFKFDDEEEEIFLDEMSGKIEGAMESFNSATAESRLKRSLVSSSGEAYLGVTASSEPGDFGAFLKGYFAEMLVDELPRSRENKLYSWLAQKFGATSAHRRMRSSAHYNHTAILSLGRRSADTTMFESYVSPPEYPLAFENLRTDATAMRNRIRNLESVVLSLENLGHKKIPDVEGLTVDLLDFQKESVQWALEREQQEGGVQSFLWTELPSVADTKVDKLYLNPILGRVSREKPKLVRGGLICEEMGLGKTIISLALILSNPAPTLPVSGSIVPDKFDEHDGEGLGWDPDLERTLDTLKVVEEDNAGAVKRGTILSRGTLVICHVSLVGQWCEEAKSKLQNPGLVYPYHGAGRKRNPKLLAENSIVVTTYATLSSDKNYHAKKKDSSEDYCAPCEEVRWWRIICDESHTMKTASTKQSQAVASLISDHTWCVTGTPVSTSLADLSNQLKLIGLENLNEYFDIFRCSVMKIINDPSKAKERGRTRSPRHDSRLFGHFLFFMRNLMMRHTKTQKYMGTDTDLMALPAKTERTVEVTLTEEERLEYTAMEDEARAFYIKFKAQARKELSKYYLQLSSVLKTQRIAMSGGHAPIASYDDLPDEKEEESDSEDEDIGCSKKKKKVVAFSEFAYTSKLKVLIAELSRIRDEESHSKSLVFSNFSSTLKWLQEELPKHGFTFRFINGQMPQKKRAEALAAFQNDPPTTVFLLSMRSSNCGINLTSANRVFLLEPSMNPAAVQQAIGRVHRLGQKRKVEIIRMVVKDSIETRLTNMLEKKYNNDTSAAVVDLGASKPVATFVGSLSSDKTTVLATEFDWLFNVKPIEDEGDKNEDEDMPDAVGSLACGVDRESTTSGEI